ncbi:MAG: hypothetical protein ACTSQO_10520 [Candidatus Helarchaeota archaeon]
MSSKNQKPWEEIRRIEKMFKKKKGKEIAITIKSIEEADQDITIEFSVEKEENIISIPLTQEEWNDLNKFFISVDSMLFDRDKKILNKVAFTDNVLENTNLNEKLDDIEFHGTKSIVEELEEVTKSMEEESSSKDVQINGIDNVNNEIEVVKDKIVEKTNDSLGEVNNISSKKQNILPQPIKVEDVLKIDAIKEIPFPDMLKVQTDQIKPQQNQIDTKNCTEIQTTPEGNKVSIENSNLKIQNLDELINEIALVGDTKNEKITSPDNQTENNTLEPKMDESSHQKVKGQIEVNNQNLQTKLKELLNKPEEVAPSPVKDEIHEAEINKNSPRIPQIPKKLIENKVIEKEKIVEPELSNEERILRAMEETASLFPEGEVRNFILEMKEKRKKIMDQLEDN